MIDLNMSDQPDAKHRGNEVHKGEDDVGEAAHADRAVEVMAEVTTWDGSVGSSIGAAGEDDVDCEEDEADDVWEASLDQKCDEEDHTEEHCVDEVED